MPRVVEISVAGQPVLVQVDATSGQSEQISALGRAQAHVADAFDQAKGVITALAEETVDLAARMAKRSAKPDQIEIAFGIKFGAQGGVIVANVASEAALEVRLTYCSGAKSP